MPISLIQVCQCRGPYKSAMISEKNSQKFPSLEKVYNMLLCHGVLDPVKSTIFIEDIRRFYKILSSYCLFVIYMINHCPRKSHETSHNIKTQVKKQGKALTKLTCGPS